MALGDCTPDQLVATPLANGSRDRRSTSGRSVLSVGSILSSADIRMREVRSSTADFFAAKRHAANSISKTKEFLLWTIGMIFFWISQVALPLLFFCQMFALNVILLFSFGTQSWRWLWIFVLAEVLLVVHLMQNREPNRAATCGNLQWIVYCWIISAHSGLLFFSVLPWLYAQTAPLKDPENALTFLLQSRTIVTILWISPVFYTVLAFRSLRQLTGTGSAKNAGRQVLLRQEYAMLDVALLLDMLWHVVIDIIDIVAIMFTLSGKEHLALSDEMQPVVERVRTTAGIFVVLALFYHQQSFPSIGYLGASSSDRGQGTGTEYTPDVVKARKRSAVVSIILVDLPFVAIRTYVYALQLSFSEPQFSVLKADSSTQVAASTVADQRAGAQLDKWWVKNILCLLLQAMQLRFVQHAEQERSQSLRWWDQHRNFLHQSRDRKNKRMERDESLSQAWKDETGRTMLDTAFADAAANHSFWVLSSPGEGSEAASATPASGTATVEAGASSSASADAGMENFRPNDALDSSAQGQLPRRRRWWCGCSCRCNTCRWLLSSSAVLSHALLGLVLGWLIAKIDFAQLLNELVVRQHAAEIGEAS